LYSNLVIKHDLALSNRRANLPTISQNFPYIMDIEFVYLLKTQKHIKRAPKIDNARVVKSSISFPVVQIETRYTFLCCITKNQKCTNYKFCFAELFFMSTITAEKLCFWKHPPAKSDHKYLPSVKTVGEESYSLYYYC